MCHMLRLQSPHSDLCFFSSLTARGPGSNGAGTLPNRALESLRTGAGIFLALLITLRIKWLLDGQGFFRNEVACEDRVRLDP